MDSRFRGNGVTVLWSAVRHQAIIAPSVLTQITRQATNRLLSISVSNFMAVLRDRVNEAFEIEKANPVPSQESAEKPHSQAIFKR